MSIIFELLNGDPQHDTQITGSFFTSGSWPGMIGSSLNVQETNQLFFSVYSSGSWNGSGQTLGIVPAITIVSATIEFFESFGLATSQGVYSSINDYHSNDTISDSSPSVLEGINLVDWAPFPDQPPQEPPPPRSQRDETRYRKVSSFSRFQPVRIRIFRR